MTKQIPKLLKDAIEQNSIDIDVLTKHLRIPWLKLDMQFPTIDIELSKQDWRKKWKFDLKGENNYQVNEWNGNVLFGPTDWQKFLEKANTLDDKIDEDCRCRKFRKDFDYGWYIDQNDTVRKEIKKIFPKDEDLNLVNTYTLPPGGWLFPHKDYAMDNMGLNKIYIAVKWKQGNVFGMYGCGELPVTQGDVFLINNYSLPHWVYNGSDENRIVLDISANLHSPIIKQKIIDAFKKAML